MTDGAANASITISVTVYGQKKNTSNRNPVTTRILLPHTHNTHTQLQNSKSALQSIKKPDIPTNTLITITPSKNKLDPFNKLVILIFSF